MFTTLSFFFNSPVKLHYVVDGFLAEGNKHIPWLSVLVESALRGWFSDFCSRWKFVLFQQQFCLTAR